MTYEFKFPDVGEGITEGTLVEWKVEKGSSISTDQSVASVETDKAVVDIPSPVSGVVSEFKAQKGDTLSVGDTFMTIEDENSNSQDHSNSESQSESSVTDDSEKSNEGTGQDKEGNKKGSSSTLEDSDSDKESQGEQKDTSATPNTNFQSKSSILALPSVFHEAKKQGIDLSNVKPTGKHGEITMEDISNLKGSPNVSEETVSSSKQEDESKTQSGEQEISVSQSSINQKDSPQEFTPVKEDVIASLSVKQLARTLGVDINFVVGSGENGRVTQEDIKRAKEAKDKNIPISRAGTEEKQEVENSSQDIGGSVNNEDLGYKEDTKKESQSPSPDSNPQSDSIELTGIRGGIAKAMMNSLANTAQFTISQEVEVSELVELRQKEKQILEQQGIKLSYLPFFMKALQHAVTEFPQFNGRFNEEKNSFDLSRSVNMGIAVDTQKGLLVPVFRELDQYSFLGVAKWLPDIISKARNGEIQSKDMNNSTITITSVGSIGGESFTPILNYPEAAILGVGAIVDKPVVREGEVVAGKTLTLSLTVDHRIIDGANAARFLQKVTQFLKDPELLLMEG